MFAECIRLFLIFNLFVFVCLLSITGESKQAGETKIKYLERELLFYKSSSRILRKKLKETSSDVSNHCGDQDKTQNTQPSRSEQDALVKM